MSDAVAPVDAPVVAVRMPPEPPAVPRRALLMILIGLIGLASTDGMRQVSELEKQKLEAQARGDRTQTLDKLQGKLDQAEDEKERERLEDAIEKEQQRIVYVKSQAAAALGYHALSAASSRYRDTWLAILARCLVILGAYGLAVSEHRHYQIAGLAMLALFVYALISDVRLTIG